MFFEARLDISSVQVTKNTYIKQQSIHLQVLFRRGLDENFRHHTETRKQKTNAIKFYENLQWGLRNIQIICPHAM